MCGGGKGEKLPVALLMCEGGKGEKLSVALLMCGGGKGEQMPVAFVFCIPSQLHTPRHIQCQIVGL
jgi:hypothetical protein